MSTAKHRSRFACLYCSLICIHLCASVANSSEPKFVAQTIDGAIQIGYGVDVGDVDGDGKPDILLADKKQFVWYRNPGTGGDATSRDRQGAVGAPHRPWQKFVMAENLTEHDNVCITARDIDGDGKVEVAVGAQWNPGETSDPEQSGAIFYLIRPEDPTQKWEPIQIKPHDPTVHRMRWVRVGAVESHLVVLPLHGWGNANGQGEGVNVLAFEIPNDVRGPWKRHTYNTGLHMTHNFDVGSTKSPNTEELFIGGKEGMVNVDYRGSTWIGKRIPLAMSAGELRIDFFDNFSLAAAIEPMHGNQVVAFAGPARDAPRRVPLDATLNEGHALAISPLLDGEQRQIVAGWRKPNAEGKVGIRMYVPLDEKYEQWKTYTIDDNTMACEDLKVADLDGDGKLDIVASGRATKNVIVYWNRTGVE